MEKDARHGVRGLERSRDIYMQLPHPACHDRPRRARDWQKLISGRVCINMEGGKQGRAKAVGIRGKRATTGQKHASFKFNAQDKEFCRMRTKSKGSHDVGNGEDRTFGL